MKRDCRIAVAAPRGHAKSTLVSLAYVLWSAVYARERHIIIVSATLDQAVGVLRDVKRELTDNPLLASDFPKAVNPTRPPWQRRQIVLPNNVMIEAYGAGKSMRGIKHGQHRPSLIVVDDVEDPSHVIASDQREKLREWFNGTLLKVGAEGTNVIVVGTVLHYDSLLARLIDPSESPGWESRKYQAVEAFSESPLWLEWSEIYSNHQTYGKKSGPEAAKAFFDGRCRKMTAGTKVLWDQKESYHDLMVMRQREGETSFQREKQNEPWDRESCIFSWDEFQFWEDEFETEDKLLEALGPESRMFGSCDPSMGKAGKGRDPSAIITALKHKETGVYYVLDADVRKRTPERIITEVMEYHRRRKYLRFAFETNQFQEFLGTEMTKRIEAEGMDFRLHGVHHSSDKLGRIETLQPLIHSGTIRFSRRHRTLLDQLRQFPLATHDDGPDALHLLTEIKYWPKPNYYYRSIPGVGGCVGVHYTDE